MTRSGREAAPHRHERADGIVAVDRSVVLDTGLLAERRIVGPLHQLPPPRPRLDAVLMLTATHSAVAGLRMTTNPRLMPESESTIFMAFHKRAAGTHTGG